MSLGGIALGIGVMVDAGSVMVENIFRHLAEDGGKRDIVDVALAAGEEVAAPIFFSVLIIIVTFMPMFALTGTEGKMYMPLAWANSSAMAGSLILALTVVPVLSTFLLKGKIKRQKTWAIALLQGIYRPILKLTLKLRWLIVVLSIAAMAGALLLVPHLRTAFMPSLNEGTFLVMPTMLPSVSLTEATETAKAMDRLLAEIPEIDLSVSKVGRAETAMDPAPINMIETIVTLKPKEQWRAGMTQEGIELQMMENLSYLPGLNLAFTQPIAGRLAMLTTGIRTDLGLKLYGEDIEILQQKAFDIERALAGVSGVSDLLAERVFGAMYLEIQINREKLARYGLNIADVENAIEMAIGGRVATTTIEGRKRFDVLVRYNWGSRENIDAMRDILIPVTGGAARAGVPEMAGGMEQGGMDDMSGGGGAAQGGMSGMGGGANTKTPAGGTAQTTEAITDGMAAAAPGPAYVPLGEVARFQVAEGPSMVSNEDGIPLITVQLNSRGRDIVGFVEEADRVIREKIDLPPGYSLKWTGQYENQQRAKERLTLVIPVVIAAMFFLMYMAFDSFSDAILVLLNIPFSLVGGIAALFYTGTYMTLAAAVGFIAVGGIAVENGVLMVSCFKQLREREGRSLKDTVGEGALSRLRPVLITAGTTLGGTLSLLFATGAGAEMQRPIAVVIVGGLATSTLLTLIVLPCIYMVWYRNSERGERQNESIEQPAPSI
jgi:Cu(I)/Ag(I) efflux system membrane protein CusA/SilA